VKLPATLRILTEPRSVREDRRGLAARLRQVERRIDALGPAARASLRARARRLADLRAEVGRLTGSPRCCAGCEARLLEPTPGFDGGLCCGTGTEAVTGLRELAALALAGARSARAPGTDRHAGCMFRTTRGCTLAPRVRPTICVRYLCRELTRELHARGVLDEVLRLGEELDRGVAEIEGALGLCARALD
jgi:hypothetical protein